MKNFRGVENLGCLWRFHSLPGIVVSPKVGACRVAGANLRSGWPNGMRPNRMWIQGTVEHIPIPNTMLTMLIYYDKRKSYGIIISPLLNFKG